MTVCTPIQDGMPYIQWINASISTIKHRHSFSNVTRPISLDIVRRLRIWQTRRDKFITRILLNIFLVECPITVNFFLI